MEALFRDRPDVFVAGDLLWYPIEGDNATRLAPDVLVAFGRPKGHRGSYHQWHEGGVAPQVVFEVLSPGNRQGEMIRKFRFYERYGVEEYYLYDPDRRALDGWFRREEALAEIEAIDGWESPRLGVHFDLGSSELRILDHRGQPFRSYLDLAREHESQKARADRLAARLTSLGVDPEG